MMRYTLLHKPNVAALSRCREQVFKKVNLCTVDTDAVVSVVATVPKLDINVLGWQPGTPLPMRLLHAWSNYAYCCVVCTVVLFAMALVALTITNMGADTVIVTISFLVYLHY